MNPKVKGRQADNGVALLNFFIDNQDESNPTFYRAPPKRMPVRIRIRTTARCRFSIKRYLLWYSHLQCCLFVAAPWDRI